MYRYLIISILILLFIYTFCFAEGIKEEFSQRIDGRFEAWFINEGMVKGRNWKSLSEKEKYAYLLGYEDGTFSAVIHKLSGKQARRKAMMSLPISVEGGGAEYTKKEIDKFYQNEKNLGIPIYYVLLIITNRLKGVKESKIERYIEYLRNPNNKDLKEIISGE